MRAIGGKIDLVVPEKASAAMGIKVSPGDHRQVVRIGWMKQRVKVSQAGAARCQIRIVLVLASYFVVDVFENNNQYAVEVASLGPRGSARGLLLFSEWRLRELRRRLGLRLGLRLSLRPKRSRLARGCRSRTLPLRRSRKKENAENKRRSQKIPERCYANNPQKTH